MRARSTAMRLSLVSLLALGAMSSAAWAADMPTPRSAVTHHVGEFNGVRVKYTTWVEDNFVDDSHGKPGASIITVAYTRDGVPAGGRRPVIFAFNGGPGAAGSMLNFGALGPVRLMGTALGRARERSFRRQPREPSRYRGSRVHRPGGYGIQPCLRG